MEAYQSSLRRNHRENLLVNKVRGVLKQTTLSVVKAQNFQRAQINAIGVLQIGNRQDNFLRSLATGNGGTYTNIQR